MPWRAFGDSEVKSQEMLMRFPGDSFNALAGVRGFGVGSVDLYFDP